MAKKQAEYTLSDIIRLRPSWFMDKQTDVLATQQMLNQLHAMLDAGMQFAAAWSFHETFGDYNMSTLTPATLNQRLFSRLQVAKAQKRIIPRNLLAKATPELLERVSLIKKDALERESQEAVRRRIVAETNIANYMRKLQEAQEHLEIESERLQAVQATSEALSNALDNFVPSRSYAPLKTYGAVPEPWRFLGMADQTLWYMRTEPLTMTESNTASGVMRTMDMGFYVVGVSIANTRVSRVYPVGDNRTADHASYHHPHVSRDSVCWGNVGYKVEACQKAGDVGGILTLLDQVMQAYNASSPWITWETLAKRSTATTVFTAASHLPRVLTPFWDDIRRVLEINGSETLKSKLREAMIEKARRRRDPNRTGGNYAAIFLERLYAKTESVVQYLSDEGYDPETDEYRLMSADEVRHAVRCTVGMRIPDVTAYTNCSKNLVHSRDMGALLVGMYLQDIEFSGNEVLWSTGTTGDYACYRVVGTRFIDGSDADVGLRKIMYSDDTAPYIRTFGRSWSTRRSMGNYIAMRLRDWAFDPALLNDIERRCYAEYCQYHGYDIHKFYADEFKPAEQDAVLAELPF